MLFIQDLYLEVIRSDVKNVDEVFRILICTNILITLYVMIVGKQMVRL